jgi:hypothetical protein
MDRQDTTVAALQEIMGYYFSNPTDLWLALQAAGSGISNPDGNKVVAMIGDAIIRLVTVDDLAATGRTRGIQCLL